MTATILPECPKCKKQPLLPLSDYGENAPVLWKAWACADARCGYSVRIDKGRITYEVVKTTR